MVKNEKGFTIIELLAVVVLASIIIAPLMSSMVSSVTTNIRLHTRRSSVSIAEGAIYGFDKLSFTDLQTLQDASSTHHLVFDADSCNQLTLETNDSNVCEAVFGSTFNNVSFDSAHFKVYIYDYNLDTAAINWFNASSYPSEVVQEITSATSTYNTTDLLRVTVWINYSDDPYEYTIVSGLLIGDWTDSIYGN